MAERPFVGAGAEGVLYGGYYLPDVTKLRELPCGYEQRVLESLELSGLYLPEWSNALCEDRKERDVLGMVEYPVCLQCGEQWKCQTVGSTEWNSRENAKMWRRDLADTINATNEQLEKYMLR